MKIFITGASGFIGKHIVKLLSEEQNQLLLLVKDEKSYKLLTKYNVNILISNLNNIQNCKEEIIQFGPQVCLHLAWEGIPDYSFDISKRNLDNSLKLINLIVNETNCKKIIISGSCYEYGKTIGVCKESNKANINSFFSWAKYALYRYCRYVCKESNTDLVWYRIFYVYGPGQRKKSLIPTLIWAFKNGVEPQIAIPFNANDFVYVGDVAEAFRIAVNKKINSGIYNLGTGKSTRVIDICKIVEKMICGSTYFSDKINMNSVPSKNVNFWADINKTQKALSWKPITSVEEGIRNLLMHKEIR